MSVPRDGVPIGPFREWLEGQAQKEGVGALADRCGVNERRVRTFLGSPDRQGHAPQAFVSLATVDRVLCAFGSPFLLNEMYPLEEDEMDMDQQRADALEKANRVRVKNAETLREIRAMSQPEGMTAAALAIQTPTDEQAALGVIAVLRSVPGFGRARAVDLMALSGIGIPDPKIRDLSERQRQALSMVLRMRSEMAIAA